MNLIIRLFGLITFLCVTASAIASEDPAPAEVAVTPKDLLPVKVIFQVLGKVGVKPCDLQISETEIKLQRWGVDSKLVTVATMPMQMKEFEGALAGINKDYFRGTVTYKNPHGRDGGTLQMITKLGDISEYLVFTSGKGAEEKWPQAILRLKPVFEQFGTWLKELREIEDGSTGKKSDTESGPRE